MKEKKFGKAATIAALVLAAFSLLLMACPPAPTPPTTYGVTVNTSPASGSGTASADLTAAEEGETITVTAVPAAGYKTTGMTSADATVDYTSGNTGTFTMPAKAVTITVTFGLDVTIRTITKGTMTGGDITISPASNIKGGDTITVTAVPEEGKRFKSGSWASTPAVEFVDATKASTTFIMPNANITSITAEFEALPEGEHSISFSAMTGGTVSADKVSAAKDALVTLTVTPDTGYKLTALTGEGVTLKEEVAPTTLIYTFDMPDANVTLSATFTKIDYTLAAGTITGGGTFAFQSGSSSPSGTPIATANYGDKVWLVTATNPDSHNTVAYTVTGADVTPTKSNNYYTNGIYDY
ncbi:MAG: hypothetical protein LBM77_02130, partial [Spirochaetaceae bacterium]|nr:hypothetical protein [Spirochaetaceae bacterium]